MLLVSATRSGIGIIVHVTRMFEVVYLEEEEAGRWSGIHGQWWGSRLGFKWEPVGRFPRPSTAR